MFKHNINMNTTKCIQFKESWPIRFVCALLFLASGCEKGCTNTNVSSVSGSIPNESKSTEKPATQEVEAGLKESSEKNFTRTLVFFGDSLTAGYGLKQEEAFPAKVKEKMDAAVDESGSVWKDWKVVNSGVSGDTTRGGLERTAWVLKAKPTAVFLCLGANDGLRGLSLDESKKNLKGIIEALLAENVQVLLGGMELPANYGLAYRTEFRQMYVSLAKEYQLSFLPFLLEGMAMKPELSLPDGIHPNAKGAEVIAENVWLFLQQSLKLK